MSAVHVRESPCLLPVGPVAFVGTSTAPPLLTHQHGVAGQRHQVISAVTSHVRKQESAGCSGQHAKVDVGLRPER